MAQGGKDYYNLYETRRERKNMLKGFLSLIVFMFGLAVFFMLLMMLAAFFR